MKKYLKGFTLIELIIVMAILVILMASIMMMFRPVRETYVDATLYESRRTAQNGVIQYLTESVRFSTDLGMYTKSEVSGASDAIEKFTDDYLEANGVKTTDADYSTKRATLLEKVQRNAEVIIIDNTDKTYSYNGYWVTGRILRRKFITETTGGVTQNKKITDTEYANEKSSDEGWRIALGNAYYGQSDYAITFEIEQDASTKKGDAKEGIKVKVASKQRYGLRSLQKDAGEVYDVSAGDADGDKVNDKIVTTSGMVMCKNQCAPVNGMFDTKYYNSTNASGIGTKVYIVYINEKIKIV